MTADRVGVAAADRVGGAAGGRGGRADVVAAAAALALVAGAAAVGVALGPAGQPVRVAAPPLFGHLAPHAGPGTPLAVVTAVLVVRHGAALAGRLRLGRLLALGYLATLTWTFSLALVDGWQRGVAGRLTTRHEYLREVPGVTDVPAMLRGFAGRILDGQPDSWTTHVSGHPPGALLVFVALDRIGLGGGAWAAALCVLVGASATVSVTLALRALAGERVARAAVPFLVLFPGAVWVGVSADGLFTGVTAAGVAALAVAARRHGAAAAALALAAGLLLGAACFLSYGLVLLVPVAVAVLAVTRRWRLVPALLLGAAVVVAGFAAAGFWWPDGYHLVVERYHQGIASARPFRYWAWANLACLVLSAGPAAAPIVRRAVTVALPALGRAVAVALPALRAAGATPGRGEPSPAGLLALPLPWQLVPLAAAVAVLAADASGLSKAEVERIWLPFAIWLVAGAPGLPAGGRRRWLALQAATALAVNHLVLTGW